MVMQELRRKLKAIDKLKTREFEPYKERTERSRDVAVIDGNMRVLENGRWQTLTLGDLLTDGEWGVDYILDDRTIPRDIHKKLAIEEAKRELQNLLDRQIVIDEVTSRRIDSGKKGAYEGYAESKLLRPVEEWSGGMLAELLFQNMLKKIGLDGTGDFEIIPADVFQDVNQKVDFIIQRKIHGRGVRVETQDHTSEGKDSGSIGIQLTLQQDPEILRRKERQITSAKKRMQDGELTDIVLVSIKTESVNRLLRDWIKKGRPHGGPDALWDTQTKTRFLHTLLDGVLPRDLLEKITTSLDPSDENLQKVA